MHNFPQDQQVRQTALDIKQSFIVQAPAGSGKTELLMQRFLALLNQVKKPEEILAITFTKKAANEMRSRILQALRNAKLPEPEAPYAKTTWNLAKKILIRDQEYQWNLLNNPNQLRIQTIDALCTYLTKQLPLLSHFGATPDILEDATSLYRIAVEETLMHVEESFDWSDAIAHLLLHMDNDLNKLQHLIVHLLAKRDQWLPYLQLESQEEKIKLKLENYLKNVIEEKLCALQKNFPLPQAQLIIPLARYAANNLHLTNTNSIINHCASLQSLPSTRAQDKNAWLGLASLLLTQEGEWRKSFDVRQGFPAASAFKNPQEKAEAKLFKQNILDLVAQLSTHEDLRLNLLELHFLPDHEYTDAQWHTLQSLLIVLKITTAQLRLTFQQYGKIDFIENAQAALLALGNEEHPTDLALALDYQIRHILVDEFQDTAFTQYQLLEKLTWGWETNDGRTLFIVGDPMQSIYRFREAEVGIFIRMQEHGIGNIKLIPLKLNMNFRSAKEIVQWNNSLFSDIFPAINDISRGAVAYSESLAQTTIDNHSYVKLHGFCEDDTTLQTHYIIKNIKAVLSEFPKDKIAILVRSRSHLHHLIPALQQADISYTAVDIDNLATQQVIQDLLSLTCALFHPYDRIAWLALLRAPWCGLDLADLLLIANDNVHASIWEQIQRPTIIAKLSEHSQKSINRIISILKNKFMEREQVDLRTWLEETWLLMGGPAALYSEKDLEYAQTFFQLLTDFSIQHDILEIDKLKEKIEKLYASSTSNKTNVEIMTIHSAKGLEFDTVIVPRLECKQTAEDTNLLAWMEYLSTNKKTALLLGTVPAVGRENDKLYEFIQREHALKSAYEVDRLLYVASTRAKKRLFLVFSVPTTIDNKMLKPYKNTFLSKFWAYIEKNPNTVFISEDISAKNIDHHSAQHYLRRLVKNWENPIKEYIKTDITYHQKINGFLLTDTKFQLIGTVIHRILQYISLHQIDWWLKQHPNQQHDYLTRQLLAVGLSIHSMSFAISHIERAIQNTLADKRGLWILKPHREAKSEFALSAMKDNVITQIVIDRTFIDDNNVRWIIDYKTTTFTPQDLDNFLTQEYDKYKQKMHTYAEILQAHDPRPIRLGLYFPLLSAWKEWEMREH